MPSLSFPSSLAPQLLLLRLPGFGYRQFGLLEQRGIDAAALVGDLPAAALSAWLPAPVVERLLELRRLGERDALWQQMLRDVETCAQLGVRILLRTQESYPDLLRQTSSAPPLLFVRGDADRLHDAQLAIVGARTATAAGLKLAEAFARELCERGLTITSGLALGIDAAAHAGALAAGNTIAVLGTGIDMIYPRAHQKLASRILEQGAIVSELPPASPAKREHFPRRNRLISGLSRGVLVVEAALQSGSLITAHFAAEQGRDVFAIPGSIHSPLARGCHALIRNGATLVESVDHILAELGDYPRLPTTQAVPPAQAMLALTDNPPVPVETQIDPAQMEALTPPARALFELLGSTALTADVLLMRSQLSSPQLSNALLELELAGLITHSAGGYQRQSQHLPAR